MQQPILDQLNAFNGWRGQVAGLIQQLEEQLALTGLLPGSSLLRLGNLAHAIANDSVRAAFVGEFSRGKSELINALFFSEFGGRLLPSSSGQTTMCPVEIQHAGLGVPGLRLLPITSRALDHTIQDLKRSQSIWRKLPLLLDQPAQRNAALKQLTDTSCVPLEEARKIGLCPPLNQTPRNRQHTICPSCGLGKVQIPRWRHAIINLPHPILAAGLNILDTPGLNAIGAEPELTLSMLMEANAVIFILSADTGVTHSDLDIWENYIASNPRQNHLVVLNKIDTLWDELKDPAEIEREIAVQVARTAERLGIDARQVIAVSAQKALIGRVKNQTALVEQSRIETLEDAIARQLIPARRERICHEVRDTLGRLLSEHQVLLKGQIHELEQNLASLTDLKSNGESKVPALLAQHQRAISRFEDERSRFEKKKRELLEQAGSQLFAPLDPVGLDLIISNAKNEMLSAWTTAGIQERLRRFFTEAMDRFDLALNGVERLNSLMLACYSDLEQRHGLNHLDALPYAILPRRAELQEMAEQYERFGKRLEIAVNTQSTVVRKAFLTVAQRTRDFVAETLSQARTWVDEAITLMESQMERHMQRIQQQVQTLQDIEQVLDSLDTRIVQVRAEIAERQAQQQRSKQIYLSLKALLEDQEQPEAVRTSA